MDNDIESSPKSNIEETTESLETSFRQAWQDAQQGNLLTEDEFWKALQEEV